MAIDTKIAKIIFINGIPNFFNEAGESLIVCISKEVITDSLYTNQWPSEKEYKGETKCNMNIKKK